MVLLTVAALQHRRLRSRAQQGRLDRKLVPAPLVSRTRCGRLLLLRRLLRNLQGAHRGCRGQLNAGDGLCRVLSRRNPDLRGPGQPPFARQSGMDSGASQDHLATPGSRPTRRATLRLSRTAPSSAKPSRSRESVAASAPGGADAGVPALSQREQSATEALLEAAHAAAAQLGDEPLDAGLTAAEVLQDPSACATAARWKAGSVSRRA